MFNESKTATVIILSAIGFLLCPNSIPAGVNANAAEIKMLGSVHLS